MAKYLLVYHGGKMPESQAEMVTVLKAWESWYTSLGSAVVDPGNPFTPAAKLVSADGTVHPHPAGSMSSGYTLVQADSLDAAAKMARTCPVLQGGAEISVFETFEVGM